MDFYIGKKYKNGGIVYVIFILNVLKVMEIYVCIF